MFKVSLLPDLFFQTRRTISSEPANNFVYLFLRAAFLFGFESHSADKRLQNSSRKLYRLIAYLLTARRLRGCLPFLFTKR